MFIISHPNFENTGIRVLYFQISIFTLEIQESRNVVSVEIMLMPITKGSLESFMVDTGILFGNMIK